MKLPALEQLEERIGYHFQDTYLLSCALTHSSWANEQKIHRYKDYERLEFLGDAVLEMISSAFLFHEYPDMREGELSKRRAALVCEPSLAECARRLGIEQHIRLGRGAEADGGRVIPVLTMGPICITPELKRKGYGKALLDYSLEKATELGFGAVLFEGNIGFYGKCGFTYAREFGIRYHDLPEDTDDSFFLCKELIPGYLDDVTGVYQTPQGYYVRDCDVEEFDKGFPPKQKLKRPGQLF